MLFGFGCAECRIRDAETIPELFRLVHGPRSRAWYIEFGEEGWFIDVQFMGGYAHDGPVLLMKFLDLTCESAAFAASGKDVIVSFIPTCDGGQLWTWEFSQRAKEKPVDDDHQAVKNVRYGKQRQKHQHGL